MEKTTYPHEKLQNFQKHSPDAVILYPVGDFYEVYGEEKGKMIMEMVGIKGSKTGFPKYLFPTFCKIFVDNNLNIVLMP